MARRTKANEIVCDAAGWWLSITRRSGEIVRVQISRSDVPQVRAHHWFYQDDDYVATRRNGRTKRVTLHRFLRGDPEGCEVDHRNGVRLDCRRRNLRVVPSVGNTQNVVRTNLSTGHRNVYYMKRAKRYVVHVGTTGQSTYKYGGCFKTLSEALRCARRLRREVFEYVNEARH